MSVKIMSRIFESELLGPTKRLIMLALADHADDAGRCYPSIDRLCRRTGLKERAVQSNIRRLQADGFLRVIPAQGPKGCNVYLVSPDPAPNAPPQEMHPAGDAPTPAYDAPLPPQEMHPNHHRTIKEPSGGKPDLIGMMTEVLSKSVAIAFLDHRKNIKKPLTEHATKLLVTELKKIARPDDAANRSILNGWAGVFPDRSDGSRPQQSQVSKYERMGR